MTGELLAKREKERQSLKQAKIFSKIMEAQRLEESLGNGGLMPLSDWGVDGI